MELFVTPKFHKTAIFLKMQALAQQMTESIVFSLCKDIIWQLITKRLFQIN